MIGRQTDRHINRQHRARPDNKQVKHWRAHSVGDTMSHNIEVIGIKLLERTPNVQGGAIHFKLRAQCLKYKDNTTSTRVAAWKAFQNITYKNKILQDMLHSISWVFLNSKTVGLGVLFNTWSWY